MSAPTTTDSPCPNCGGVEFCWCQNPCETCGEATFNGTFTCQRCGGIAPGEYALADPSAPDGCRRFGVGCAWPNCGCGVSH
jgi:hypothetical protein